MKENYMIQMGLPRGQFMLVAESAHAAAQQVARILNPAWQAAELEDGFWLPYRRLNGDNWFQSPRFRVTPFTKSGDFSGELHDDLGATLHVQTRGNHVTVRLQDEDRVDGATLSLTLDADDARENQILRAARTLARALSMEVN